jgi:hypothetical protein
MALSWNERRLIAYNKRLLIQVYSDTGQLQLAYQTAKEAHDLFERLGMIIASAQVEEQLQLLPRKNGS